MWFRFILFTIFISTILSAAPDYTRFHCLKSQKPKSNATIPLADEFSAFILAYSPLWQIEWQILINQLQNEEKNVSKVERTEMNGTMTNWTINYENKTGTVDFSDGSTKNFNISELDWEFENPFNISSEFLYPESQPPKSLIELIQWAQNDFKYVWKIEKLDEVSIFGIDGDHFVSCRPFWKPDEENLEFNGENNEFKPGEENNEFQRHWVEVEMVYPGMNPNDKLHKQNVPMSIELKSYRRSRGSSVTVFDYVRFEFFLVQNATQEGSNPNPNPSETNDGYSTAVLIGVAVGMILLGILIGIIVGYFGSKLIHPQTGEIPYQNQPDVD